MKGNKDHFLIIEAKKKKSFDWVVLSYWQKSKHMIISFFIHTIISTGEPQYSFVENKASALLASNYICSKEYQFINKFNLKGKKKNL